MKKDDLGNRMKEFYEDRTRYFLPRRTYSIIRIDGKSFHTYTKGCKKPFDTELMSDMDATAVFLCKNIQGAKMAYVQSDEISIVLTDFDDLNTDAWFGGNIQKICSVSASIATAYFNKIRNYPTLAYFDSRVFTIPTKSEVLNYLVWRQLDCIRNSIFCVGQNLYGKGSKELFRKSPREIKLKMKEELELDWDKDYSEGCKFGRFIFKDKQAECRDKWVCTEAKEFLKNREFLNALLIQNL